MNNISWVDYMLIGIGILLLPMFFIGLIPIGMAVWNIGRKMGNYKRDFDEEIDEKYGTETTYDKETLEEWK